METEERIMVEWITAMGGWHWEVTVEKPITCVNRESGQKKGSLSCPYPRTEMYLLITASTRKEEQMKGKLESGKEKKVVCNGS